MQPLEPEPTNVRFPDPRRIRGDIVAVGADFRPGTLLLAYRSGIFPWPQSEDVVGWFSPDPRALLPLDKLDWSRSLRRTLKKHGWRISVDEAFGDTMVACATERPEGTWITPAVLGGYARLHELGWAHSLEVWEGRELVGGIYGIAIGASFAGESMFHRRTDASKVAFASLAERLRSGGYTLFDAQVMTPHLASLGVVPVRRRVYLDMLARAVQARPANVWASDPSPSRSR